MHNIIHELKTSIWIYTILMIWCYSILTVPLHNPTRNDFIKHVQEYGGHRAVGCLYSSIKYQLCEEEILKYTNNDKNIVTMGFTTSRTGKAQNNHHITTQ